MEVVIVFTNLLVVFRSIGVRGWQVSGAFGCFGNVVSGKMDKLTQLRVLIYR